MTGTPGSSSWTMLPTPPEMFPVRTRVTLLLGLIESSRLVLCAPVKTAVQVRPLRSFRSTSALSVSSRPLFLMLPTLVVTKLDKLVPAATGMKKMRSLVRFW